MSPSRRTHAVVLAISTLLPLALYVKTAAPGLYYGDSGELAHAVFHHSLAHPPGYPLYVLLGQLFVHLPGVGVARGLNLMSAVSGALACGISAAWLLRLTGRPLLAISAALLWAGAPLFRSQTTVTEVYALENLLLAALFLAVAAILDTWRRGVAGVWPLLALGWILGAGLAHRPTIVLALPALALWIWLVRDDRPERMATAPIVAAGALAAAVPALLYGWIFRQALSDPATHWAKPGSIAELWEHATVGRYAVYRVGPANWIHWDAWRTGLGDTGIALVVIVLLAAGLTWLGPGRRRRSRRLRAAAAACATLAVVSALFGALYAIPDQPVLYLTTRWAAFVLAMLVVAEWRGGWQRRSTRAGRRVDLAALAVLLVALAQVAVFHRTLDRSEAVGAAAFADAILEGVPRDGILLTAGDEMLLLAYRVGVEGARPDVTIYDRFGLMFRDLARDPGSPPRAGESMSTYRARRERELITRFRGGAGAGRPVVFQALPDYEAPAGLVYEPVGLVYHVRRVGDPLDPGPVEVRFRSDALREEAERLDEPFARMLAATFALRAGERFAFEGRVGDAETAWQRAAEIAPASEMVRNHLGFLYMEQGRFDAALRHLQAAVQARPRSWRSWNNLAHARLATGDPRGARQAWETSLGIVPAQNDVRQALQQLEQPGYGTPFAPGPQGRPPF